MIALSSLAAACTITGAFAELITFALLIVVVEHYLGNGAGASPALANSPCQINPYSLFSTRRPRQ